MHPTVYRGTLGRTRVGMGALLRWGFDLFGMSVELAEIDQFATRP